MRTLGIIALIAALATPVAALSIVEVMTGDTHDSEGIVRDLPEQLSGFKTKTNDQRHNGASPVHNEILDTQIG